MDIYGYQSWQCNSSDELAKQVYAQQALATSLPYRTDGAAVMPVPSGAPWNMQGLPWGMPTPQPPLVQFTAQSPGSEPPRITPVLHCKRKPADIEPIIPAKQLITEEKMAAHLSGLHISSEYTSHMSDEELMEVAPVSGFSSSREHLKGHTIILADEIKRLREEPLIPASLIEKLEKPCMSLVLWQPKENVVQKAVEEEKRKSKDPEEPSQKRNGVLVGDHHTVMDVEM